MSNRIQISRIPTIASVRIPSEAKAALIDAKNLLRSGAKFEEYRNDDDTRGGGPPLPKPSAGCSYRKVKVGTAHPGDTRAGGTKRLVIEFHDKSRTVREVYYTEEHYQKSSFVRVV